MWSYYNWVYFCCRPSVNIICGRIMIGLSLLSSVSKHNMWSYYDWVVVVFRQYDLILCLLTEDNDNPIIIRPHIVFTDDWVYCCCRPSVNIICGRVMIGLSLSSVSKHNMLSCYDITRPHIVFTDGRQQQRQPNHNTTTYCVY
jgi:hypothetical protein